MILVSIVVCCYNSASRLPVTLKYLAHLKSADSSFLHEIIIVDNASTDNTTEVAIEEWAKYRSNIPFIIVKEPVSGLTAAREKGIVTAKGEFVLFCDDDNWLDCQYLVKLLKVLKDHPDMRMIGGQAIGEYEIEPEKWVYSCVGALAIGPQATESGVITKPLYGAGLVLHRASYLDLYRKGFRSVLTDRKGNTLVSGGDTELCLAFLHSGYRLYYEESMQFRHYMTRNRLTKPYMLQLCLSGVSSAIPLAMYDYIMKTNEDFDSFHRSMQKRMRYNLLYYGIRIVVGRHRFYALIYFKWALKALKELREKASLQQLFDKVKLNLQLIKA